MFSGSTPVFRISTQRVTLQDNHLFVPAQVGVVLELQTFEALVVDPGESQDVRDHRTLRIIAAPFHDHTDSVLPEGLQLAPLRGIQFSSDPHEIPILPESFLDRPRTEV